MAAPEKLMPTCNAFGVMPSIAKSRSDQSMYQFLSGYTAQVDGTEVGLGKEPKAVFSTRFGAPFMPRHPSEYAKMLGERISRFEADCWLVNTGWSGGAYAMGKRIAIVHTPFCGAQQR
jgi:phosphoenolpyruvate carboxykinase (ATP)